MKKLASSWLVAMLSFIFVGLPMESAHAATGDSDTYLNLQSNTTSGGAYATAAYNSVFHIDNAITVEAWVRPTSTGANPCQSYLCSIVLKDQEWALSIYGGTYQYAIWGGSVWSWVDTTIPARLNTWQHVALTRTTNSGTVNFYLNGKLVYNGSSNGAGTGVIVNTGAYNFTVGAWVGAGSGVDATSYYWFIGDIDEVKVWNTGRTTEEVQTDMTTHGPTNNSNLKIYYDFNDVSGSTATNKAQGSSSSTTVTLKNSPVISSIATSSTAAGNTVVTIPRTYLSSNGYKLPVGISSMSLLAVGAGGGGGNNVGNGGSGGGGYSVSNYSVSSTANLNLKVGTGGAGGRYSAAGTITYDGTFRTDGQSGDTTTATINGASFTGGGGGGGSTIWSTNYCGSTGEDLSPSVGGVGIGSGGTASTGGLGGTRSATQSITNGKSGFTSSITGTSTNYSGGGGSGAWSGYIQGNGANSIGGNGNGANGSDGTGSGGGGNAAGCAVGGNGGSGIIILSFAAYTGEISLPASPVYRTSSSIVATVSTPGIVAFYEKGKVISTCKKVATVSSTTITATCSWKPSAHGVTTVSARFTATGGASYPATLTAPNLVVAKRTNSR